MFYILSTNTQVHLDNGANTEVLCSWNQALIQNKARKNYCGHIVWPPVEHKSHKLIINLIKAPKKKKS